MKRLLLKSALAAVLIAAFASFQSCASWVEADHNDWADVFEPKSQDHYDSVAFAKAEQARIEREQFVADSLQKEAEAYQAELKMYAAKRAYHKNPHRVMFCWLSWSGLGQGSLAALPEEVDYVSIWLPGNTFNDIQLKDLREFQKRGGKAWLCWRVDKNGSNVKPKPWMTIPNPSNQVEAMRKYADHIADLVEQYGFNGFDYDSEPTSDYSNNEGLNAMVNRLRERFDAYNKKLLDPNDPLYNPDRLAYLCIDLPTFTNGTSSWANAYWNNVKTTMADKFDLMIWQTYDAVNVSTMTSAISSHIANSNNGYIKDGSRVICTSDFEGADNPNRVQNLKKVAATMQSDTKLMGLGAYRMELDIEYPVTKEAIASLKKVSTDPSRWHPLWPENWE